MASKKIFLTKADGKVKAILNWRSRDDEDAVILSDTLDTQEMYLFHDLKELGEDEEFIFEKFFPKETTGDGTGEEKEEVREVTIDIEQLNKPQLAYLIERKMNTAMPSLRNMSKEDLIKMFLELIG